MPLPHGLYDLVLTLAQERRLPDPQAAGLDLHDLHPDESERRGRSRMRDRRVTCLRLLERTRLT
jgi:hypothetical protein